MKIKNSCLLSITKIPEQLRKIAFSCLLSQWIFTTFLCKITLIYYNTSLSLKHRVNHPSTKQALFEKKILIIPQVFHFSSAFSLPFPLPLYSCYTGCNPTRINNISAAVVFVRVLYAFHNLRIPGVVLFYLCLEECYDCSLHNERHSHKRHCLLHRSNLATS